MRTIGRGLALGGMAMFAVADALWAHPGHVTHGGLWHTLTHALSSPYHVAIIAAVVVLAVAWVAAVRPTRAARRAARSADEPVA